MKWGQTKTPLIVAESGGGKTQLIRGVAAKLHDTKSSFRVIDVDIIGLLSGPMFPAEKEDLLRCLFCEMSHSKRRIFAIENIDSIIANLPCGGLLVQNALDGGLKLIATTR